MLAEPTRGLLTVAEVIARQAESCPDAVAILAPDRPALTYGALWRRIADVSRSLSAAGIGRDGRVAVVLPDGPEMAVAILSVMAHAACAPLVSSASEGEYRLLLANLRADALIVPAGEDPPAVPAARALGVQVIRLSFSPSDPAGAFALTSESVRPAAHGTPPLPETVALLMHTSGTTSKPKVVPLTHRNLIEPIATRVGVMKLTRADRCLAVSPLSTSTGVRQNLIATVVSGGSVVCTPGFRAGSFVAWLDEFKPTYFSASPTVQRSVLEEVARRKPARPSSLRFVRSAAARLPGELESQLEATLRVPVVQSYGMTETGLIAQNPLPPGRRQPGSVGIASGAEVRIIDDAGDGLRAGAVGEVVVRGPGVMNGYENDPEANREAFHDGWFRTGDQGYIDEGGYLFLTGRLKEVINRGGSKVSPAEIDEVLVKHPEVLEAAAFPVPHPSLGEDIAAAVVLHHAASVSPEELRGFAARHLAPFKVPSRIVIVAQLPRTALGKARRGELASVVARLYEGKAGLQPRNQLELHLTKLWEELLNVASVGATDNFFELGGDSLLAARLVHRIEQSFGRRIPLDALWYGSPTVAHLAELLRQDERSADWPMLVGIKASGSKPPLFCVHTVGGNLFHYHDLASNLDAEQPVLGLQARGVYGSAVPRHAIQDIAADCIATMRERQARGPFHIAGYSSAGLVAFEMARQLGEQGDPVGVLALIDTFAPAVRRRGRSWRAIRLAARGTNLRELQERALHWTLQTIGHAELRHLRTIGEAQRWAHWSYRARPYPGAARLIVASESARESLDDETLGWRNLVLGGLDLFRLQGDHASIMKPPTVHELASVLQRWLDSATCSPGPTVLHNLAR